MLRANALAMSEFKASSTSARLRPVITNNPAAGVMAMGSRPASDAAVRTAARPRA
jgi:hypothetical protein